MSRVVGGRFKFVAKPFLHNESDYTRRKATKHIVVHCSDTKRAWNGGAEEIRGWHINERGWMDIGYHFVIRRDGTIERGRPTWAVGAGVAGYNSAAIHISLVGGRGDNGKPEDNFEPIQKEALRFLIESLLKHVAPNAQVLGHRDFPGVTKACPSFDVRKWWGEEDDDEEELEIHGAVFPQWFGSEYLN